MTDHLTALEQAQDYYTRRGLMTNAEKIAAAVELSQWGVFSSRQLGKILDFSPRIVSDAINKSDRTGGMFEPSAIPYLIHLIHLKNRGDIDIFAVKRALHAGCSTRMASRLTGISQATISRYDRKARGQ